MNENDFLKHLKVLESKLTSTQKTLMNLIHNGKNVFLDGSAGTGKSFTLTVAILQCQIKYGMNTFAVISPTKVAAALVGGVTFHSFLQIDSTSASQDIEEEQHKSLRPKEIVIQEAINRANGLVNENNHRFLFLKFGLRILFIDEVSMLSHDQIIYLDYFFRTLRQSNTPFGGLQIILCGDHVPLVNVY
jgi:ATP-dependent DNA helicase PIF1